MWTARTARETLRQTSYAQPALFAVEMGLARLWQSWGFEPDVVLGHSVGQYSAACVAGVFSLEDGALLMAERGRLFGSLPAGGRMVAVFTAAERVESLTDEFPSLSVAAYNGANTVLSGPAQDLEKAVAGLAADGVRCDWLDTSHAFHSALLDPILDEFESYAERFNFSTPQRILIDNRTGAALGRSVKLDGAYWRRHARQPVEFAKSVRTLADLSCKVLLEIGPRPVLTAAALRAWPDPATAPRAIASLRRNTADHRQITEAVADAYVLGHLPDFAAFRQAHARKLDLPTYPFEHRQYWFRDNRERPDQQQHARGRAYRGRPPSRGRPDRRTRDPARRCERRPSDPGCADQACGTTQPTTYDPVHRGRPLRDPLGEIRCATSPARKPARDPPGSSSAMTPSGPAVGRRADRTWPPAPDPRVAGVRRGRGTARRRVARCGSRRFDATYRACRGPRLRRPHRRCGHCCGCNTESWAEHGGSSAPRLPLNCAAPSGW